MRGIPLIILLALQVTLYSKSTTFKFEHYTSAIIEQNKVVLFDNSFLNESLFSFSKKKFNFHISSSYLITSSTSQPCSSLELEALKDWSWSTTPKIIIHNGISNNVKQSDLIVYPYFIKDGIKQKLTEVSIDFDIQNTTTSPQLRSNEELTTSEFNSGDWFKFKVDHSGMYKMTYEELIDLNILSSPINKDGLSIYSNSSRMLDFMVGNDRAIDLNQLPTKIIGEDNNETFGPGSSILFYAEANGHTFFDATDEFIKNEKNLYSDTNYVFLNISSDSRKKLTNQTLLNPTLNTYDYTKYYHHELELTNFIKSGREWIGEQFIDGTLTFNRKYHPPIIESNKLKIKFKACARYTNDSFDNKISLSIKEDTVAVGDIDKVSTVYYRDFVKFTTKTYTTDSFKNAENDSIKLNFTYHLAGIGSGWLDYFILNSTERLNLNEDENIFILSKENNQVNSINVLSNLTAPIIWDITDLHNCFEINTLLNDSGFTYNTLLDTTRKFIAFDLNKIEAPLFESNITNQNLHSATSTNYLIITDKIFSSQANRLIDLHFRRDGLTGQVVFVDEIYNEFSTGRPEATAIRDFIKQLYKDGQGTEDSLKYVLLLGKGSYDPKNRLANNINYIPTFQSLNSVKLTSSYVTDDFFGLMDDHEGTYNNSDLLDLGIGRIPVKTEYEAEKVVDKIFEYYDEYPSSVSMNDFEQKLLTSKGNWKNNILFVADDEDGNTHINQSNSLAQLVDSTVSILNQKKIYVDAFPQESTSIGDITPGANEKLNKQLHEGALIVNYTGHGGELGWTSERIYLTDDIQSMENRNRLPLFMTATCEFSRFDSPEGVSAGEYLILKPQGGAIALFTTVRLVFSIPNFKLNETFYKTLKESVNSQNVTIGDIFKNTKVINNGGTNDRNFTLLGDPAVKLAISLNKIQLDSVSYLNDKTDTIKALSTPTVHGKIISRTNDQLIDFNGTIEILLFDKKKPLITLANDDGATPYSYESQEDLLFIGKANVKNGYFSSQIFIPKDTRQDFDFARLSFYAVDSILGDASGFNESILIGGTNLNSTKDSRGPEVEIFLDDTTFVFGDNVTPAPVFIARLTDSSGVNIIPNDVGKDISLTIDERSDLNFVLNDYYSPSVNSFQNGEVIFPLDKLEEGRHSLEFKVFDNQNNSSKAYTEFIIENNPELALKNVLNYPNPFTTSTGFYFEHNQNSNNLEVVIHIYTISGKIIKTLTGMYNTTSQRVGPIEWDGLDEYGDKIGRGVYVYQVTVINSNGDSEKAVQKLVLLR